MSYCIKCGDHPEDALNVTYCKLTLLVDLVAALDQNKPTEITGKGVAGLYWFLSEAAEALKANMEHPPGG